jgi:hypothetical protein
MIRLKDLKNEFKVIKSITLENAYNLYSNTRHGNRSVFLYLGYVTVKNGKVTHYPTGTITSDIKELHEIVNNWADNAEYDVITYSPDCRAQYVAEVRLHDFMTSMGFEYDRNIYSLTMNKVAGNKDKLKIDITVKDKDNNEYEVIASLLTDEYSWIDLSGKSYKDVMDNITSIMRAITLTTLANSFEVFNKTKDANMDLVNEMVMSNVSDMMVVEKKSFKEYLINTLEETLNNLKK